MPRPSKHVPAILDALMDGDATAIEISAEIGIERNLAFYTLRALERQGLARESRRIMVNSRNNVVFALTKTRKSA